MYFLLPKFQKYLTKKVRYSLRLNIRINCKISIIGYMTKVMYCRTKVMTLEKFKTDYLNTCIRICYELIRDICMSVEYPEIFLSIS